MLTHKYAKFGVALFLTSIYILFPTQNSTIDAYAYAGSVKYGTELFHPHHLLYNVLGHLLFQFIQLFGIHVDALHFMKIINAVFGLGSLYLLFQINKKLNLNHASNYTLLLIVGLSFGVWRFTTENETYIIPIFFSLWGSLHFLHFFQKQSIKHVFYAGFWVALACLFHQIHVFWWIGLLTGIYISSRSFKKVMYYLLPSLIVPVSYILVLKFYNHTALTWHNITRFVFLEFYTGGVDTSFDVSNLKLSIINFIRTFIQVHGIMLLLVKKHILFIFPALISGFLVLFALLRKKWVRKNNNISHKPFLYTHVLIFSLQFIFAVYSVGNAEFMVMLPFLAGIILFQFFAVNPFPAFLFGLALFVWNFSYGIFPNYYYNYYNNKYLADQVVKNPQALYILSDQVQINNEVYYYHGFIPENTGKSPTHLLFKGKNTEELTHTIDSCIQNGQPVYTDCIDKPQVTNRASFVFQSDANEDFFNDYSYSKVDSFQSFLGKQYILQLKDKP